MIALLDYGAGNVGSVLKAVRFLGYEAQPVDCPEQLSAAQKIIFPGQGHFGTMMKALADRHMSEALREALASGKPFFGICLGLQALYEGSDEAREAEGLGLLPGRVRRFRDAFKVPHVGWSQLEIRRGDALFEGVADGSFVYYCHSYYAPVTSETAAVTEYGESFAAATAFDHVWAVQFHPEKSAGVGLRVLRNFLEF
jgi:imidazole glycerol phosphate synthase glutamine amidotransferase subunit